MGNILTSLAYAYGYVDEEDVGEIDEKVLDLINNKNLDQSTKEELLDIMKKVRTKEIDFKKLDEYLVDYETGYQKLIPICLELGAKIYDALPAYQKPKVDGQQPRRFRRFIAPKVPLDDVTKSMDAAAVPHPPIDFGPLKNIIADPAVPFNNKKITREEFLAAFKESLDTKKDMMGISKKILHSCSEFMQQDMINKFNNLLWNHNADTISNHSIGRGTLLYKEAKKGPKESMDSFRTILTIPTVVNHFHRVLAMRIVDYFINNNYIDKDINKGSIPNIKYGILEQIFKVKNLIKDANQNNKQMQLMFVDISNAFPSVKIGALADLLRIYKVDEQIVRYIETYYKHLEYYIRVDRQQSTEVKHWNRGLIQGCPMSPMLFVVIMNFILKNLATQFQQTHGYIYHARSVLFTAYVDDICILCRDQQSLSEVFTQLKTTLDIFGLKISEPKTAIMAIHTPPNAPQLLPEIKRTTQYKYLGETLNDKGDVTESYKLVMSFLCKRLYWLDNKKNADNAQRVALLKRSVIPWLQKKMVVLYDMDVAHKKKIASVVDYHLKKWDCDEEIPFTASIKNMLDDSKDEHVKDLMASDEFKAQVLECPEIVSFKKRAVVFKYEDQNDIDNENDDDLDSDEDGDADLD